MLDLDTTDLPLHGHQEGRFFHGYCDSYCYLPLFIFAGEHLLCARLRTADQDAARLHEQTGTPARVFTEFSYRTTTGSWSCSRRVVAKAEQLEGKENPRFVVTNMNSEEWPAQQLYEDLYCERGEMENHIKEQLSLFAGRVSAETMRANQLRVYFAALASSYPWQWLFGQVHQNLRHAVPLRA